MLHKFTNTPDGLFPDSALVEDSLGNRTAPQNMEALFDAYGVVFKVDKNGKETVLYSFTGGSDECRPVGVTFGPDGDLYGVRKGAVPATLVGRSLSWIQRGISLCFTRSAVRMGNIPIPCCCLTCMEYLRNDREWRHGMWGYGMWRR